MILPQHLPHFERLRDLGAFRSPMLMLGRQDSRIGQPPRDFFGVDSYLELDPDGGDLPLDLAGDVSEHHGRFGTVFDLGTIEHLWDAHAAWSNAARLVAVGGVLVVHTPVAGWERHGAHVTDARFIRAFLLLNGFRIDAHWLAYRNGQPCDTVRREGGSVTLWLVATKDKAVKKFAAPQQCFESGSPVWIGGRDARGRLVRVD